MRLPLLIGLAGLVSLGAIAVSTGTAHADPDVTYTTESGTALDPDSPTTLTVSGSGFQSINGGFGGVYVFFGTVSDGWRPSQGGVTGGDYRYVPDSEAKNNKGHQRFVAFPGSDTENAANGGTIAADGTWSTDLVVPGATFESRDRDGSVSEVDCLEVTCGIITVGAHGVANARNESFTPVEFAQPDGDADGDADNGSGADDSGAEGDADRDADEAPPENDEADKQQGSPDGTPDPKGGKPVVSVDPATAVVGRVLSFTGHGFTPGEQIVVTLDDGIASVGPLTAGESGEIAGVLELPAQVEAGTHTIRMTGASSQAKPVKRFAVRLDPNATTSDPVRTDDTEAAPVWESTPFRFLIAAACVLVIVAVGCALALVRARRTKARRTADAPFGAPAVGAEGQR